MTRGRAAVMLMTVAAMLLVPAGAHAQFGGIGGKIKAKAKARVEQKENEAADKVVDAADPSKQGQAAATAGEAGSGTAGSGEATSASAGAAGATAAGPAAKLKPGEGAWANYDFVPGEKVLFADDFSKDVVGDFPRRLEFKSGALEIVESEGARWLRASADSRWFVPLPDARPERFTMEFDYYIHSGEVWIYFGENENIVLSFSNVGGAGLSNSAAGVTARYNPPGSTDPAIRRARIMVDGSYAKVYLDDKRVLNVPNAGLERASRIQFYTDGDPDNPSLFGNFRLAAGGKKLYDAIAAEGRVATQGIYFDTGSDVIRPESTPTLREIAAMLKEHGDLRLTIEGHTDNVGGAEANRALSEKRAAAVKAHLVTSEGIDASRLETKGMGDTKPAVPNTTPEGRQQNRRVELVKS
jgi:outer membrane protein OmpA-like peptidoglycan-associated protein